MNLAQCWDTIFPSSVVVLSSSKRRASFCERNLDVGRLSAGLKGMEQDAFPPADNQSRCRYSECEPLPPMQRSSRPSMRSLNSSVTHLSLHYQSFAPTETSRSTTAASDPIATTCSKKDLPRARHERVAAAAHVHERAEAGHHDQDVTIRIRRRIGWGSWDSNICRAMGSWWK